MTRNSDLENLAAWADAHADRDPDLDARPLWAQIAAEVNAYLGAPDQPAPHAGEPLLEWGDQ